jgi:2-C-methyl-D-erythritol 4-phosphate cytidylyltransferase/2-C-methyl-D-erythritol 2,4-cyclodiphosphate synthase
VIAAVIVAAGSGQRFGWKRKQFEMLCGRPVILWSVEIARRVADLVVAVLPPDYLDEWSGRLSQVGVDIVVAGGETRTDSVRSGLAAVRDCSYVLVHDAARPLASSDLWRRVAERLREVAAQEAGVVGCIPVLPVTQALKVVSEDRVLGAIPRDGLFMAQTPQGFLSSALRSALARPGDWADEAEAVCASGFGVAAVAGEPENIKITWPADLAVAEALLARRVGQ